MDYRNFNVGHVDQIFNLDMLEDIYVLEEYDWGDLGTIGTETRIG